MAKKHTLASAALMAIATALGFAANTGSAHAQATTRWNGSPETREDDRRFHVNGRFMYDMAYSDRSDFADTAFRTYARRAFLGVDGRLSESWRYNVKFDFSFGSPGNIKADDLYLEYAGRDYSLIIGNNNAISALEDRESSLNIPFNERSFLVTAAGFGKRPGVSFLTNGGNWSWGLAVQSNDGLDSSDSVSSTTGNESGMVTSRFTWAPIFQSTPEGTTLLHLGLTGRYRDAGNGSFTFSPGGLSNKVSNSTTVAGFDQDTYLGGEIAFQHNAFGVEAEYGQLDTQSYSASGDGYYVDVFWSPTGESRSYKASDGSFGSISPARPLGAGGIGHVMLAARYENLDLTDSAFSFSSGSASELTAYTVGATWVPIDHVKFQLNYSSSEIDRVAGTDFDIDAVTLRTQFDW